MKLSVFNSKTSLPIKSRVAKGVRLMNSVLEDWFFKVDLRKLDIDHCYKCILGQLYSDFFTDDLPDAFEQCDAVRHGFLRKNQGESKPLTAEWNRVIRELRAKSLEKRKKR